MKKLLSFPPVSFLLEAVSLYSSRGVGQTAAALSYLLVLTLFPLLVCVNYSIGLLELDFEEIVLALDQILPDQALSVIQDYLDYIAVNQSPPLLIASLSTLVLSASAGLRTLLHTMDRLYDAPPPHPIKRVAASVFLSLLFLLTIYLSVIVIFTGEWFFSLLEQHLPRKLVELFPLKVLGSLWQWMRYLLLFCFVLVLVLAVYRAGVPKKFYGKTLLLCALLSALALVAFSVLFSWFIDLSSRYSLIYGSLASIIILLVWLYLCGNILLLGAVMNRVWRQRQSLA